MALLRRARRPFQDEGAWLAHLQAFLVVRDAQRRVALLQLDNHPGQWMMPSENVFDGASPDDVVAETARRWFRTPLQPRLAGLQNYPPEDGDEHWMVVLLYEAPAPARLEPTPDTTRLEFFPPGQPPGPMFKDHATVFRRLAR